MYDGEYQMRALVVFHKVKYDLGSMESVLIERGFDIDFYFAEDNQLPKIDHNFHDLAIILGGPMGVYESDKFPNLLNEKAYIKKRLDSNLPTLGICLGGQLMASALGADVYKSETPKETGWKELDVNEAGLKTVIRHFDKSKTRMTQAHQDTFNLPEGAVLLASSAQYKNQIFAYGDKALGFQCHPEANEFILEAWTNKFGDFFLSDGMTVESVEAETKKYLGTLKNQTKTFLNEWLDQVGLIKNA